MVVDRAWGTFKYWVVAELSTLGLLIQPPVEIFFRSIPHTNKGRHANQIEVTMPWSGVKTNLFDPILELRVWYAQVAPDE